ncbi:T-complex protein 11-like protein 1 [Patella vulgata]|uniref:T-complex protein 11-like protein 1 n=1 Tax=Patella vulgata TaxID=6465 RepID=UPI0024A7D194|nr:T-complex protein 11-like protein 1 [Patella vulgata]XP_050390428.2 T-complex protein 11-like protein 1 [Patella vulgata]
MADKGEDSPDQGQAGSNVDADQTEKKRRTRTPSPTPGQSASNVFMVPASPPKFISFEQLMSAANGVKNMTLAHEIVVDSDFELEKKVPEENSLEKMVTDIAHKAFWDLLEAKLSEDPPEYRNALVLIQEVKETLFMIIPPQSERLKNQINEILDMDLIQQKMENDAFDIRYYADYVIGIMARLCAPVRDENVNKLKTIKDIVPLFKGIFEVLDLMKRDMANYTIAQIRPYLQQQSVEYERKKFTEFLDIQKENNLDGLQFAKVWLKNSHDKLKRLEDEVNTGTATPVLMATPQAIMNEAYMELLQWNNNNPFPEMCLMDQGRFHDLQTSINQLTLVASILLVTYNTVGAPIAGLQDLKQTLTSHILTLLEAKKDKDVRENVAEQVKAEVNKCLMTHAFPQLGQKSDILVGQIKDVFNVDNAIHTLMKKRLMDFIREAIKTKHVSSLKVPTGFSAVESKLSQVLGKFLRLISHNRSVFGVYYAEIIGALIERHQDLSPR